MDAATLAMLAEAEREGVSSADEAQRAAVSANAGKLDEAATGLAAAMAGTTDLRLLFAGFQFFFRTGDVARAEALTVLRLELAELGGETEQLARACTNLGLIHLQTGRVATARSLCERAVAIDERIGNEYGLARSLGNLANVHEEVGELGVAEGLNLRALEIAERIGAAEMAAGRLANLGDICSARGEVARARAMWRRAVEIFRREGVTKWLAELEGKLAAAEGV